MRPQLPTDWLDRMAGLPPDGGPSGADWVRRLPAILDDALQRWALAVTGPVCTGRTAVVLPVTRSGERGDGPAGQALALKVIWPHPEALGEHLALRHWAGHGAVHLVAADPASGALLLERLDPERDLRGEPIDEACQVIGELLAQLHVPAPPSILAVSDFVDRHLATLAAVGSAAVPRRIVSRTQGLARELAADAAAARARGDLTGHRLLHTDLHFENVLAGGRAPWLAIDPKPMAGHPGFELQPVLRNRVDELGTGSAFRWSIRRRLQIVAEAAGIDDELARLWSLMHTGLQIGWAAAAHDGGAESLHIAIFKALQD